MVLRTLDFKLVDVFADSPLRGNQLAVFLDTFMYLLAILGIAFVYLARGQSLGERLKLAAAIYPLSTFNVSSSTAYSVFILFFASSMTTRLAMAIRPFKALFSPLIFSAAIATLLSSGFVPLAISMEDMGNIDPCGIPRIAMRNTNT